MQWLNLYEFYWVVDRPLTMSMSKRGYLLIIKCIPHFIPHFCFAVFSLALICIDFRKRCGVLCQGEKGPNVWCATVSDLLGNVPLGGLVIFRLFLSPVEF